MDNLEELAKTRNLLEQLNIGVIRNLGTYTKHFKSQTQALVSIHCMFFFVLMLRILKIDLNKKYELQVEFYLLF